MPIHADNPSPYVYCQGYESKYPRLLFNVSSNFCTTNMHSLLKLYGKSLSAFPRLEETIMSLSESDLGKLNSLAFLIDHYTNMKVKLDKVVGVSNLCFYPPRKMPS